MPRVRRPGRQWQPPPDSSAFPSAPKPRSSLIGPSIVCGAVGLRPTYGRVSRYGCMQLCWSLDKIGPICRSADDCGLVLAAIHGADPRDAASVDRPYVWPSSRELSTIRVGYVAKGGEDEQRDDLRVLRELGVKLVPVEPPNLKKDYGLPKNELSGRACCQRVGRRVRRPHASWRAQGRERLASVVFAWPFSNGCRLSEAQSAAGHRHAAI